MPRQQPFDIEIDKLTRSVENAITGDRFLTDVVPLTPTDLRKVKKADWLFDWKKEGRQLDRKVFKLIIKGNPDIIHGLISMQDRGDHIFMALIEAQSSTAALKRFTWAYLAIW